MAYVVMVAGVGRSGHVEAMTRNMTITKSMQEPEP